MFGLAKQYFRKGKLGFTSATITGERRIGKTMYAMQTVYQICRYEGQTKPNAWTSALNAIVFSMDELVKVIKRHSYYNRRRFLIWDDSGVAGSGLLYRYNMDNAALLKALMDTVGTRVRLMMLTCPDDQGLLKFLRRYQDYLVNIEEYHQNFGYNGRLATVLKPYRKKNQARAWRRAWSDEFNVKIEQWVFDKYVKIRDSYSDRIIKELLKRGEDGRKVAKETYGETEQLVGQSNVLNDVAATDFEGDVAQD
jgi:hypothetical protein